MQTLWFYGFVQWFISGGYQVCIVVVNLEDGTDRLSRNVGKELSLFTA